MKTKKISELMIELECILNDFGDLDVMVGVKTAEDETTLGIIHEVERNFLGEVEYVELS
jgi:hypothetical protein